MLSTNHKKDNEASCINELVLGFGIPSSSPVPTQNVPRSLQLSYKSRSFLNIQNVLGILKESEIHGVFIMSDLDQKR